MYQRLHFQKVIKRIEGPRRFMQVLAGPRQVGKSTLAHQVKKSISFPAHYASTDGFVSVSTLFDGASVTLI